jgi:chemotaxis protein MotA
MRITFGLFIIFSTVFGGFLMAKGNIATFWQPAEYLMIMGAGLGSLFVGNSTVILKEMLHQIKGVFAGSKHEAILAKELLSAMYVMLGKIKKDGLKTLDEHVDNAWDSPFFKNYPHLLQEPILVNFITDNLRLLGMGKSQSHEVEGLLEKEIMAIEDDLLKPSKALHKTGEAMPGFGILAAVAGIVITMGYLDGPLAAIGLHVAAALIGTFIGIFLCYCIMEPLASAMHDQVHRQISQLEGVKAIIIAYMEAKPPIVAVDAGRRVMELDIKPSFATLESWMKNNKESPSSDEDTAEGS